MLGVWWEENVGNVELPGTENTCALAQRQKEHGLFEEVRKAQFRSSTECEKEETKARVVPEPEEQGP